MKILSTLFIIIIFSINICVSQTKDTTTVAYISVQNYEIEPSSIKDIKISKGSDFEGSYHFGESEGESNLEIIYSNKRLYAVVQYAEWENNTWVGKTDRAEIYSLKDTISVDNFKYTLATNEETKGLKSHHYTKENGRVYHYIQFNPHGKLEKPFGDYPEGSFVRLKMSEIIGLSKKNLKMMRNEIFARNGYIFKFGGEMDKHFKYKEWYKKLKKTKNPIFSKIEKYNIQLIKSAEKLKLR